MGRNCALIPKVKNKNGQNVDSKLYKDLLSFLSNNRTEVDRIYKITKGEDFIRIFNPQLSFDDNGEPTVISLLQKTNLGNIITNELILRKLNKDIGHYKKGQDRPALFPITDANSRELTQKAIDFNRNSEFKDYYVASVVRTQDTEKGTNREYYNIRVYRKDRMNSVNAEKMEYNEALNKKLRDILASHGITIGALNDLEQRMGIHGVTDFDTAKTTAEGLIEMIRLAEGIQGEKALPEEFAHFAIRAMGDNPLINRLINYIDSTGLTEEILGEDFNVYNTLYEGNRAKLAEEASGKLLAKHLLQSQEIPIKPYKNLLQRVIQAVKDFFKKINANSIQKALIEADKNFGYLAKEILNGNMDEDISVINITSNELFYSTSERIARDKKLLESIIDNESKRLKIYEKRNPKSAFSENQRVLINKLIYELIRNNEIDGIYTFAEQALGELRKVNNRLITLQNTPAVDLNEKAKVLRDARNYLYSYQHIADDIKNVLLDEEKLEDNRYGQRIRIIIDDITILLNDLFKEYNKVAMPIFINFIKPFVGENITIPFGKWKGKQLTAEDLIRGVKRDDEGNVIWYQEEISFFDRWLDSMADSSDYMLKIIDQAVKKSKELARLDTIDIMKELQSLTMQLEQNGIKDTAWMFEKDSKGNLTGRYISDINFGLYKEAVANMEERLKEKYGENPINENAEKYKAEKRAWFDANTEIIDNKRLPKMWKDKDKKIPLYANTTFINLSQIQKDYYNKVMDIKAKLDSYLPPKATYLTNAVKIRKDLLERIKASDDVKSGSMQVWEAVKDQFIRRSDDTDFGEISAVMDFEKREVMTLPIYYTKLKKGESNNDISTDIVSTLTAYAAMANDFNEMNKVIDVLELCRDMLREREIIQTKGDKPIVEKFQIVGRKIENNLTKLGDKSRFIQRLNDFFEMQVYGRYLADEGTFGKSNIDKGKVANFVNRVTSLNTLAVNALSGISNIATGTVMMRIESFCKEFFNASDVFTADKIYGQELPSFLGEVGNRIKTSKIALWDELFNVLQEYESDIKDLDYDRKTWFSRMFGTSALYLMNNAGEHWMQNRTSLALANTYKMKDKDGNIVSLWDAMEVVYNDPNNHKLGAKLQIKKGYTKENGSEFTREDIIAFSRKVAAINQRMHGIYNKADKNAVQRLAIGRIGMMFRKWIKPSLNRRFKSASYNYDIREWTEGYYATSWRFLTQLAKEIKEGQFTLITSFKNLDKREQANIFRAITEVGQFLAIALIIGLIDWPDDDDRPWLSRMAEYQARRLYTEMGSLIPGPQMVNEGLKIIKSPAAGINTMEKTLDLIGLLNPYNYEFIAGEEALMQSGRFKGKSKATKLFFESPLLPMNKTIYRGLHPEEGIPFFKQ